MTKHRSAESESQQPTVDTKPQPAAPAQGAPEATPPAEGPTAQLREELDAAKDRALRCHAELENYRKRASRELDERLRYANIGLLRDLLPVLDNVERAIAAAEKHVNSESPDADAGQPPSSDESCQQGAGALLHGFRMVQHQLEDVLKHHHCHRIDALHKPFDPNLHHAVMQQPSGDFPENTVLMVTQQGYQLHDRVVRPSQVIVSKAT
ncbi:MAG: nucleotide exchange factor GrpE [Thermoguttaceae bacterium]